MTRLRDGRLLRAMLIASAASAFVAIQIALNDRISFHIGSLHIRGHNAAAPAVGAFAVVAAALALAGVQEVRRALAWWWARLERHAAAIGVVLALSTLGIGLAWGTFAAGGSDSYCYLNQAEVFARGDVRDFEPLGTDPAWPGSEPAFVPTGHRAAPGEPGVFVPICPAGYPLLLAGMRVLFGRNAMFWVTPLFGALAVWLAFVLGRRLAGPAAGVLGAALAMTSPIFAHQVLQPMNDVTAAALWLAALAAATRTASWLPRLLSWLPPSGGTDSGWLPPSGGRDSGWLPPSGGRTPLSWLPPSGGSQALVAGLLSGAALMMRPNLLPLAGVVGLCAAAASATGRIRTLILFSVAVLPGVAGVLLMQNAMYGSPLRSGYGDLDALFSASHVLPNLLRYTQWTGSIHTPLIAAGFAAPVLLRGRRREALSLVLFALATLACYLPYVVFDAWWYQRFLLPGLLPLLIATAAVVVHLMKRLDAPGRMLAFFVVCCSVPVWYLHVAIDTNAFHLRDFEARFKRAGEYAARLPPESAFITGLQSGTVRFYSGRPAATWGGIEPGRLAEAIEFLRRHGRKPYLLFEVSEEQAFRQRFAQDKLGGLDWPPIVEIDRVVRIYDPADYDRYMRGEFVPTERIIKR